MDERIEKSIKACQIAGEVLKDAKKMVKPGVKLFDLAESIEKMIVDKGAKLGFPANLSLNETAAHYTPKYLDEITLSENDVLKVDVGSHVDGYLGDTAITVDLSGNNSKLVEASESALNNAISIIKPGVKTNQIGEIIENEIKKFGFKPVGNLSGHSIERYKLHAGKDMPNVKTTHGYELKEGDIFAIEPFATNGTGRVTEVSYCEIFKLTEPRPVRLQESRKLITYIQNNFSTLPFAERWLAKNFNSRLLLQAALKELLTSGVLKAYPPLIEVGRGLVSQAEHTILVEHDSAKVLTKAD